MFLHHQWMSLLGNYGNIHSPSLQKQHESRRGRCGANTFGCNIIDLFMMVSRKVQKMNAMSSIRCFIVLHRSRPLILSGKLVLNHILMLANSKLVQLFTQCIQTSQDVTENRLLIMK